MRRCHCGFNGGAMLTILSRAKMSGPQPFDNAHRSPGCSLLESCDRHRNALFDCALNELIQKQVCGSNETLSSFLHSTTDRLIQLWKSSTTVAVSPLPSVLLVFIDPYAPMHRALQLIDALSTMSSPMPHLIIVTSTSYSRSSSAVSEAISEHPWGDMEQTQSGVQRIVIVLPCESEDQPKNNDTLEVFSAAIITMSASLLATAMRQQDDGMTNHVRRHIAILHSNYQYLTTVGGNLFCCSRKDQSQEYFSENDVLSVHHLT